jgi:hypothetical protein
MLLTHKNENENESWKTNKSAKTDGQIFLILFENGWCPE